MVTTGDRDFIKLHREFRKAVDKFVVLPGSKDATPYVESHLCALQEGKEGKEVIWNQSCDSKLLSLGTIKNGCLKKESDKEHSTPEFIINLITKAFVSLPHWSR
jgi:hypothetical protein